MIQYYYMFLHFDKGKEYKLRAYLLFSRKKKINFPKKKRKKKKKFQKKKRKKKKKPFNQMKGVVRYAKVLGSTVVKTIVPLNWTVTEVNFQSSGESISR